jgi:hypothetical protein
MAAEATITGTLHWPRETDGYTPPPDPVTGMWFARDVPAMAEALRTEPVLVVARSDTGDGIERRRRFSNAYTELANAEAGPLEVVQHGGPAGTGGWCHVASMTEDGRGEKMWFVERSRQERRVRA